VLFLHEGIVRAVQGWKTLAVSSLEQSDCRDVGRR
jgi:hypothetical protein